MDTRQKSLIFFVIFFIPLTQLWACEEITNCPIRCHSYVLLVEDEKITQVVATRMLQSMGFNVRLAVDGEEGLKVAQELERNAQLLAILTDVQMPKMDGITFIKTLRSDKSEFFKNLLIICMSANDFKETALQAGASCFLLKPVDIDFKQRTEELLFKK